ncbi:hypothetical protein AnaeK_2323 [Anaeromyxobacter sp. K]|nr:hypothetical protein AnaeK_2323 [Anaeromyxobacter sp. K]
MIARERAESARPPPLPVRTLARLRLVRVAVVRRADGVIEALPGPAAPRATATYRPDSAPLRA